MKIAFISDIHEDIVYLRSALRKIEKLHVDEIICLGDISGFSLPHYKYMDSRNAHECLRLVRENCKYVIPGNHDFHGAKILPRHCSFFDFPEDWYQMDYQSRHQLAGNKLWLHEEHDLDPRYTEQDKEFLSSLTEYQVVELEDHTLLLSHYVFPNISGLSKEFYTYRDEFAKHFKWMKELKCSVSFTGHSHPKGFFMCTENRLRRSRHLPKKLENTPVCIGIPPITRHGNRSGFIVYNSLEKTVRMLKI